MNKEKRLFIKLNEKLKEQQLRDSAIIKLCMITKNKVKTVQDGFDDHGRFVESKITSKTKCFKVYY